MIKIPMKLMLWLVISIPIYIFYFLAEIPLYILGFILVPLNAFLSLYHAVDGKDGSGNPRIIYHWIDKYMWPWDNLEDGIANDTYVKFSSMFMKIFYWSCIRNPVGNLRVLPFFSHKIKPKKLVWFGNLANESHYDTKIPQWFFVRQGYFLSNFYWQFKLGHSLWRFWIGNAKLYPQRTIPIYLKNGTCSVLQLKKIKVYENNKT